MRQANTLLTRRTCRHAAAFKSLILLFAVAAQLPAAYAQAPAGAQTGTGARVSVRFSAFDAEGKFVEDLKPEDLRVTADGAARELLELKRETEGPLLLAVALDTSASQEALLPATKGVADSFVRELMRPGVDSVAVITFSGGLKVEQEMTADLALVRAAISRVQFVPPPGYVGGGVLIGQPPPMPAGSMPLTGVKDAVARITREVMRPANGAGRRALLLITDGVDTSSRVKTEKAVAEALSAGTVVYAIGVGDSKNFDGVDKAALRKLTEPTGGRAFFPAKAGELKGIFGRIREELLSGYVATFAAAGVARGGSPRKLKLEVVNPALRARGVQLSYPQGFYAGDAPAEAVR